jgi:hypothetical protein
MSCDDLWFARNKIFFDQGYCFKSSAGQAIFGSQCHPPFGRLTALEDQNVAAIRRIEFARRCPDGLSSGTAVAALRERLVGGMSASNPVLAPSQDITGSLLNSSSALVLSKEIGILSAQIDALTAVLEEQIQERKSSPGNYAITINETITVIEARLESYRRNLNSKKQVIGNYLTSIKPNDRELYISARKASEIYPRVPFYIPGTKETGEFWVEPLVSDTGNLRFSFKFIDRDSTIEKVRGQIDMNVADLNEVKQALFKLTEWSKTAHQQKVARIFEKRVVCFPLADCPADGERLDGKASTEIRFSVYEDGATGGRIQRNKGLFVEGYNFSIDSAMLLRAYIGHVLKEASREFTSGTQTKKDLDRLFK